MAARTLAVVERDLKRVRRAERRIRRDWNAVHRYLARNGGIEGLPKKNERRPESRQSCPATSATNGNYRSHSKFARTKSADWLPKRLHWNCRSRKPTTTMPSSFVEKADAYRAEVLAGKIPACEWVKLCVKRATDDRLKQSQEGFPFRFDEAKGDRVCKFISLLTHIQGPKAGERIVSRIGSALY